MDSRIQLICEGYNPICVPTAVYVVQGDRAFFYTGREDVLTESIAIDGKGIQIVESIDKLDLTEDKAGVRRVKDGRTFLEGPFSQWDVRNINGRVYKREFWDQHLQEGSYLRQLERGRALLGMNEHPADGRTHISRVSLITESLKFGTKDNAILGRAEICNQTPEGAILEALAHHRVRFGVSSRAKGVVGSDGVVDKDKSKIVGWDAVANPSVPIAFPNVVAEDAAALGTTDDPIESTAKVVVPVTYTVAENAECVAAIEHAESVAAMPVVEDADVAVIADAQGLLVEALDAIEELPDVPAVAPRRKAARRSLLERLKELAQSLNDPKEIDKTSAITEAKNNDSQLVNESMEIKVDPKPSSEGYAKSNAEYRQRDAERRNGSRANAGYRMAAKKDRIVYGEKLKRPLVPVLYANNDYVGAITRADRNDVEDIKANVELMVDDDPSLKGKKLRVKWEDDMHGESVIRGNEIEDDDELDEDESVALQLVESHNRVIADFEEEVARLTRENAEMKSAINESKRAQRASDRKIDTLINSAVDKSRTRSETPIQRRLAHLLESTPALERHKALLAKCETVRELDESAEALTPRPAQQAPAERERNRRTAVSRPFGVSNMGNVHAVDEDEEDFSQVVMEDEAVSAIPGLKLVRNLAARRQNQQ